MADRVSELWNGTILNKPNDSKNKQKSNMNNANTGASAQNLAMGSLSSTTSISQLPTSQSGTTTMSLPDYNVQQNTGSSNSLPSQFESFEPMAANAALGGSAFGGANW